MDSSKEYGALYTFFEDSESMNYYRQAAAHGNLTAMKKLAYFLRYGKGIEQDCRESNVAEMYAAGIGTAQNLPKSLEIYCYS